jgi:pre-mRNA-splicing factor CWC26
MERAQITPQQHETIYRDQQGRRVDLATQRAEQYAEKRKEEERLAQEMEWGKGLVQRQQQELAKQRELEDAKGPLTRYRDDPTINQELKERVHFNDPLAGYVKQKQQRYALPQYRGPAPPPNRFNIAPGYRWDGVDRSNGFEREFMLARASKAAKEKEAEQWSIQDW